MFQIFFLQKFDIYTRNGTFEFLWVKTQSRNLRGYIDFRDVDKVIVVVLD